MEEPLQNSFLGFTYIATMLLLIVALCYLVLQRWLPKFVTRNQVHKSIQIQERVSLSQKHALYIVEVRGQILLLGSSDNALSLLSILKSGTCNEEEIRS